MFSLHPGLNRWLLPAVVPVVYSHIQPIEIANEISAQRTDTIPAVRSTAFDLPNEIWTLIFEEPSLCRRDLYPVFASCHHFHELVLPILLYRFSGIEPSALADGDLDMLSDMVPILNSAIRLPFMRRLTLTFDIGGDSKAPREFKALKTLLARASSLVDLRLDFLGDLLSAYKSDLVALSPQRLITESFCDLLSSIPSNPDVPVVFVGTEIFTCRAADIKSWQLDKYRFTETNEGGLFGLISGMFIKPPSKHPLRTKTPIKQHNGRYTEVFPFISISSVHIQRSVHIERSRGSDFSPWTVVILNSGSSHWPSALNLTSPLTAEEWAAILPLLEFPGLPLIRMEPQEGLPNIPARVLDAFLDRHGNITRMHYYPDPRTIPDAPAFPYASLRRMRNITTTARCVLHLFHEPEDAFPYLFIIRINGADEPHLIADALRLLARHRGYNKLILEVSSGSWMNSLADTTVVSTLRRVDTVILAGFTDFVDPAVILRWVGLFPALRRVGLQGCIHDDAGPKEQKDFPRRAREVLPDSIELIST